MKFIKPTTPLKICWFVILLITLVSCHAKFKSATGQNPQIGASTPVLTSDIWYVYQDKKDNYWFGSNGHGVYQLLKGSKAFIQYTTRDGLANDSIRGIQEDRSGHIFFTTQNGINRYDGVSFVKLPVVISDSTKHEWKLTPDDLWFRANRGEDGVYRYDGKALIYLEFPSHFKEDAYYADVPDKPWSPYEIYSMYRDKRGAMWFGTGSFGICRFDGISMSWMYEEELTMVPGGGSFGIRSMLEDREGNFWFCNTHYRYDIIRHDDHDEMLGGNYLINYKRVKGIENLNDPSSQEFIYFMSVVEDKSGDLWMATYGSGVYRFNGNTTTHYDIKDGDKDITLFSIYKDNHHNFWLGTHEGGAYKWNGEAFEKFGI